MSPAQIKFLLPSLKKEIELTFVRSQGPGGQNVNRTNSAVQGRWNPELSKVLNEFDKQYLKRKLANKLTTEGDLLIKCQSFRDQEQNQRELFERFEALLIQAFHVPKRRIATKPTKGSVRRRLDAKTKTSDKKQNRKRTTDFGG